MRCFLLLTLFALTLMACGEGRLDLITSDTITDAARCYQSVEVVDDSYLVALDKTCIDIELSGFGGVPPVERQETVVERDWELLGTLERDVRQKYWHLFHVQEDIEPSILQAYADGKDFLFVIENPDINSILPIQFYFAQPKKPWDDESEEARTLLYYPSPPGRWYEHWGPETNFIGLPIDRSESGLFVDLDLGFAGRNFQHEDNRSQDWVAGSVVFRTTRDGVFANGTYAPHIKDGWVLKIYVR